MDLYDSVGYNEKEFDPMILDLRNEIEKLDPEDGEGRSKLFDLCKEEENRTKDEAYQFLKDHIGGWWD